MAQSICILGRQPAIGRAELESVFGAGLIDSSGDHAAVVNIEPSQIPLHRLGGTIKVCKLLNILTYSDWGSIHKYLAEALPWHLEFIPEGKIRLGLSTYGLSVSPAKINATALTLKNIIKLAGRSARAVPNKAPQLSSAQVIHNQLTGETGMELVLVSDGPQTLLGQTYNVQDIAAYSARDQQRPKRDARIGMLPPKLAQIIINLARPFSGNTVLDPFCGTGVILQEALLMELGAYGTDIDPRMIEFTQANLDWLAKKYSIPQNITLEPGDATKHSWNKPFNTIAAETYLGRPFSANPKPEVLDKVISDVDTIHKKFLQNLAAQTKSGFRMCLALPAWKTSSGFRRLPVLDHLTDMGYTRTSFVHAKTDDLTYHREGQIVARELVVLNRN